MESECGLKMIQRNNNEKICFICNINGKVIILDDEIDNIT
jgi:hypothetical protein